MGSMNKAILMGNLGADPEVRYTAGGGAVANFRIATTEVWNDRQSGERQERTEWHRIVVWGKQAEHCGEYLRKGRSVLVEGRIQTREWTDQQGVKKYTTEIVADRVTFVGGGRGEGGGGGGGGYEPRGGGAGGGGGGDSGGRGDSDGSGDSLLGPRALGGVGIRQQTVDERGQAQPGGQWHEQGDGPAEVEGVAAAAGWPPV